MKISPLEVDNVVLALTEDVAEAAAVGVPDPIYGERVVLFVVPKRERQGLAEDIKMYLAGELPSYKCPSEVIFVEKIPQTASGKVFRRQLVAEYIAHHGNHDQKSN